MSMKSDRSMIPPIVFKDGDSSADEMQGFCFLFFFKLIMYHMVFTSYTLSKHSLFFFFFFDRFFQESQPVISAQNHKTDRASIFLVCD